MEEERATTLRGPRRWGGRQQQQQQQQQQVQGQPEGATPTASVPTAAAGSGAGDGQQQEQQQERGRAVVEGVVRHGRWAGPLCALLGVAWILLFPVATLTTGGCCVVMCCAGSGGACIYMWIDSIGLASNPQPMLAGHNPTTQLTNPTQPSGRMKSTQVTNQTKPTKPNG